VNPSEARIEVLDLERLKSHLRAAAQGLAPERIVDDLELGHLSRVIVECSLMLHDVYSEERIGRIMQPPRDFLAGMSHRWPEAASEDRAQLLGRFRRLPDDVRIVGDKALFDLGLLGRRQVRGYDLEELGARAYRLAGEALELLAEDRRLQEFFRQNRLLMLPLEDEVVFLRQCCENFRLYASILQQAQGGLADVARRVPLMAAAAEALGRAPAKGGEPAAQADDYLEAARATSGVDAGQPRERVLSGYERMLLFASVDLQRLQRALSTTVVDQQPAVQALCDELSLCAAGTRDPRKPAAYFLVGPTGVGKNHLVESLCRLLQGIWGLEVPMLTIEGPNYTYPSDINELRGATRGFIRSDEEGLLSAFHEKSCRVPFSVILVDEVEKAHPHLLTFFLSILDRGTTLDNKGKELDFSNSMLFFTSNLGYSDAQQGTAPIGYFDEPSRHQAADHEVRRELRRRLTPEFINRVRILHFNRLGPASAERILDLELRRIADRYRELHDVRLELDHTAREELIRRGFSPLFGARHLAATLDSVCNVEIAKKLRRDDAGHGADAGALLAMLREIRAGERAFEPAEVKRRVQELTRARLSYDTVRIVFHDGRFDYVGLTRGRPDDSQPA
jgi:MoxR-like ATPase